jgi:hypothetical protein
MPLHSQEENRRCIWNKCCVSVLRSPSSYENLIVSMIESTRLMETRLQNAQRSSLRHVDACGPALVAETRWSGGWADLCDVIGDHSIY